MDLSKLSDTDLDALEAGDLSAMSDEGLALLEGGAAAARQPEAPNYTEGMSWGEKALVGMGKSFMDTGRGAKLLGLEAMDALSPRQLWLKDLVGNKPQSRADEYRAELAQYKAADDAIMDTGAGLTGNILGTVAQVVGPGAGLAAAGKVATRAGLQGTGKAAITAGRAIAAPNTYKAAIGGGAVLGGVQPADDLIGNVKNAGLGAATGGAGLAAPRVVQGLWQGGRAMLDPLTAKGIERTAARALDGFQTSPGSIAGATGTILPGSLPTLAEATQDVGLARLQKSLSNANPQFDAAMRQRGMENNAARLDALRAGILSETDYAAQAGARKAKTKGLLSVVEDSDAQVDTRRVVTMIDNLIKKNPARKGLVNPLDEVRTMLFDDFGPAKRATKAWDDITQLIRTKQMNAADVYRLEQMRPVLSAVKRGELAPEDALQAIKAMDQPKGADARSAVQYASDLLKAPDMVLTDNPQALKSVSDHIGDMLKAKGPTGVPVNEFAVRELTTLKKALDRRIAKAVPEFGEFQRGYRQASVPLNQSDTMEQVVRNASAGRGGVDTLGNETLPVNRILAETTPEALDKAAVKATGFKRAKGGLLSDQQKNAISLVRQDAARSSGADKLTRTAGSDTVQNLISQQILQRTLGPLGINFLEASGKKGLLGNMASGLELIYKLPKSEQRVIALLQNAALDPAEAQRLMATLSPKARGAVSKLLGQGALGVARTAPAAAVGALNVLE